MNKYNFERAGFDISHNSHRGAPRTPCEIKGSYGESMNRRLVPGSSEGCCTEKKREASYGISGRPLASVYAVIQEFDGLYDAEKALMRGTLFSSLDLPLEVGHGGRCNG